jgi:hypothetical protein
MSQLPADQTSEPVSTVPIQTRRFLRYVVLAVAALIVIDATPNLGTLHAKLRSALDPVMDVTGLWQGSWQLFAPDVDKLNVRVEAEVLFSDGERTIWRSPDWPRLGGWQRFMLFRHQEYYDNIRMDQNRGAWHSLAEHLARTVRPPSGAEATPARVTLKRQWAQIPTLAPGSSPLPAGPHEQFTHEYTFYTWTPETQP